MVRYLNRYRYRTISRAIPGHPESVKLVWENDYQRRTLRGTGRKKKTVPVGTGKNPGAGVATLTLSMAGFFCIFYGSKNLITKL